MTHKQPAAFGSPVFRICGATPLPNPVRDLLSRQISSHRHSPAISRTLPQPHQISSHRRSPRQISGRREACPPARRPRHELRSARRLGVIGLYVLLVG